MLSQMNAFVILHYPSILQSFNLEHIEAQGELTNGSHTDFFKLSRHTCLFLVQAVQYVIISTNVLTLCTV